MKVRRDEPQRSGGDSAGAPETVDGAPVDAVAHSLAFLLKHARIRLSSMTQPALAEFGIDGRELAVMSVLAAEPLSQQRAARLLRVDRTTMVSLLDGLEANGRVTRQPHVHDRRQNVVELTAAGKKTRSEAIRVAGEAESRFLDRLGREDAEAFRKALSLVAAFDSADAAADEEPGAVEREP
jgi:DNA-binding MarR family transcriptional regulator